MGKIKRSILLALVVILSGCVQQIPKDALKLSPESLSLRRLQTRRFETTDQEALLAAGAALLQDLGFNIEASEPKLGVVVASKRQSAYNAGEVAFSAALAIAGAVAGSPTFWPVNKEQQVVGSLVIMPEGESRQNTIVRVTFQRVVWNTSNNVTISELLKDSELYQAFFTKLSKAVFLEAHEI